MILNDYERVKVWKEKGVIFFKLLMIHENIFLCDMIDVHRG